MKKLIATIAITLTALFSITGCKTLPDTDKMTITSSLVGKAAGRVVLAIDKISDDDRNHIIDILTVIASYTPTEGETFTEKWVAIADEEITKMISENQLDENKAVIINYAINIVAKGIDYICEKKYPGIREYSELVAAMINGFYEGFVIVVRPNVVSGSLYPIYDREAYEYLKNIK